MKQTTKQPYNYATCIGILMVLLILPTTILAIPDSDINDFKSSIRAQFKFDEYYNSTNPRALALTSYFNSSMYYYIVLRSSSPDIAPYDDYYIKFKCYGDAIATEFHTTDYDTWRTAGQISFKKQYLLISGDVAYDGTNLSDQATYCEIFNASGLVATNNAAYTTLTIELVPILSSGNVITLTYFCEDAARKSLISKEMDAIGSIIGINVNVFSSLWIIAQILAVILIVIGVPILAILLIRWAIYKITGKVIFQKKEQNTYEINEDE